MKGIYSEAKQQLNNCVQYSDCEDGSPTYGRLSGLRSGRQVHSMAVHMTSSCAYTTLERPFRGDKQRGRWSTYADFYFSCTIHAFGSTTFSDAAVYALFFGGWKFFLMSYLLAILFYAFPIFLIQTFLGQFSTSGSISALRISPIFKGIGYTILLLNLIALTYYCVNAAVPLVYAVNAMHRVIPWMSCDNAWNTPNCSTHDHYDEDDEYNYSHATVEFFRAIILSTNEGSSALSVSWSVLVAVMGIWLVTLAMLLKSISFIGKFLRCACVLMFASFFAIFIYVLMQENFSWQDFVDYLQPSLEDSLVAIMGSVRTAVLMASMVLGPGWCSVITLASYNSFRSNSERLAIWVSLTHVLIALMAMVCGHVAFDHFELHVGMLHYHLDEKHYMQFIYLCHAYLFGSFTTTPNLWAFLFFAILFLAEFSALLVQMMCVLTALFDEYEQLRRCKQAIIVGLVLLLMTTSAYFCTQLGIKHLNLFPNLTLLTHIILSTLLLVVITIYGRSRFQCDLQFMLGKTISNVKIFLIRFLTPIFLVLIMIQILYHMEHKRLEQAPIWIILSSVFLVALGYAIYKVSQTSGSWRQRLKQCFVPHDWHPVDADSRSFYDEIMGTSEMLVIDNADCNN